MEVNRASATETEDVGLIPGRVNHKLEKLAFTAFLFSFKMDSVKPPPCVVDRWQEVA